MSQNRNQQKLFIAGAAIILLAAFFLPWVNWAGTTVNGHYLATGKFFAISESKLGLVDPFPKFSFATRIFLLIPVLCIITLILAFTNKKTGLWAALAGIMALSLVTVYILFTCTIIDQVGLVKSLLPSLRPGIYATIIAAIGIIIAGMPRKSVLKAGLIIIGPLVTWISYTVLTKEVLKEHPDTEDVRSEYTVNALDMISEFRTNDSAANTKYKEKIITVNGRISAIETPNDSTVNIKMSDSTGSYLIFSFSGNTLTEAKNVKEADSLSVKGSCSGGEYSEILDVYFITFKRSVINKNK